MPLAPSEESIGIQDDCHLAQTDPNRPPGPPRLPKTDSRRPKTQDDLRWPRDGPSGFPKRLQESVQGGIHRNPPGRGSRNQQNPSESVRAPKIPGGSWATPGGMPPIWGYRRNLKLLFFRAPAAEFGGMEGWNLIWRRFSKILRKTNSNKASQTSRAPRLLEPRPARTNPKEQNAP